MPLLTDFLKKTAQKYPHGPAVRYKGGEITYSRLDILSDRLASCLRSHGVGAGDRVGLYLDRSIEAIVSIFGVLRAGGVYVPLEATAPPQRLAYIVNDCSIKVLITGSGKLSFLRRTPAVSSGLELILVMDDHKAGPGRISKKARVVSFRRLRPSKPFKRLPALSGRDLANIMYTSGSTAEPKGVTMSHNALCASINTMCRRFGIKGRDRIFSAAPLHFAMSPFQIFASIKAGAVLCLTPPGISAFPSTLADFIEENRFTVWHCVPSIMNRLVLHGNLEHRDLSSLRLALFSGEMLYAGYLRRLMKAVPHAEYYNLYGMTETREIACYHITKIPGSGAFIPVGKALPRVEIIVADESGRHVKRAKGARGKLYVSSPMLMKGYWHDEEATARVLFKSPFHPQKNRMICRTGDLCRIGDKGNYVLLGRKDDMVKRQGYRVGLNEIESVLYAHPQIKEAVAAFTGEEKIKVTAVPRKMGAVSGEDIRRFCRKRLPLYMVPDIIEFRASLVKTSTGKIKRKVM